MQDAGSTAANGTVIHDAPVVTLSIEDEVPAELAKRVGACMGFYDPPEHPFRMYAVAGLG